MSTPTKAPTPLNISCVYPGNPENELQEYEGKWEYYLKINQTSIFLILNSLHIIFGHSVQSVSRSKKKALENHEPYTCFVAINIT